jgi:hypothetical protein
LRGGDRAPKPVALHGTVSIIMPTRTKSKSPPGLWYLGWMTAATMALSVVVMVVTQFT